MSPSKAHSAVPVLIPVETAARELTYKTLLAARLADRGLRCYLGNKSAITLLTERLKGYVYLDKGFHLGVSEALHARINASGGMVVNLDEEGAVDYPDSPSLKTRYAHPLFEQDGKVLFWGSAQMTVIEKSLGLNLSERIGASVFLTGHPRFELLKPDYRALYAREEERIRQQYGSFVLINSNMGFGNNIKGLDHVLAAYRERFQAIDGMVAFDLAKRSFYVDLVNAMAAASPKTIVFRPHPEEDLAFYREAFSDLKHVIVVFEGSSIPWLLACDHMIHPDCTTAVEMLMLGRKPLSILPPEASGEFVTTLPIEASIRFESIHELIEYLRFHESAEHVEDSTSYPFLDSYFSYSSNAFEAVADVIEDASRSGKPGEVEGLGVLDRVRLIRREWKLRRATGSGAMLIKNKLRGFDRDGVRAAFRIGSELGISEKNVRVKQLAGHLFDFTPRN